MANSKKLVKYTGTLAKVEVPTSVDNIMVRAIASSVFTESVNTVYIDTYANDITGAPWGAQNVVWNKEPKCSIMFNANGGTGSMPTQTANIGLAFTVPSCTFSNDAAFSTWAMNSVGGSQLAPGTTYAFPEATTLYAIWKESPWKDNNKATKADAQAEGWLLDNYAGSMVYGFSGTIDSTSTYNIPALVSTISVYNISRSAFKNTTFGAIGGKNIAYIGESAFGYCPNLSEISFPNCTSVYGSAFEWCSKLNSISFPLCKKVDRYAFARCFNLSTIYLPICSSILWAAFNFCSCLTTVSLPSLVHIAGYAFGGSPNLSSVYLMSTNVVWLNDSTLFGSPWPTIYVPSSLVSTYQTATNWSRYSSCFVGI